MTGSVPVGPYLLVGGPASTVMGSANLPMIVVGSGNMGNNGALTLTTALSRTYASAYVLLPAGAIDTGIPAAATWYYATFSSASAATVFNNIYSTGTPVIPASPTAFVSTGPGAYTGSSSAQAAYTLSVAANTLGINGGVRATFTASYTNTASAKTFTLMYGGTTFGSVVPTATTTLGLIWGFKNRGATNSQVNLTIPTQAPFGNAASNLDYGTIDSTQAQNLTFNITNSTPATNNALLEQITVELLPSVA